MYKRQDENGKLKALIFDSYYDNYKGAVSYTHLDVYKRQDIPVGFQLLHGDADAGLGETQVIDDIYGTDLSFFR